MRPTKSLLTQQRVREVFDYDPLTGVLRWKIATPAGKWAIGDIVGKPNKKGYLTVYVPGDPVLLHMVHRIIWLWVKGSWPGLQLDHRNTQPADNRWDNLRELDQQGNAQNRNRARRDNKLGLLGVSEGPKGCFNAVIQSPDRRQIRLGQFDDPLLAHSAYIDAKRHLHGAWNG